MIFNKKIDNGIWLMLLGDEENRDNIMQFITNMPEELKMKIIKNLNILEEYKKTGIKNFSFLCGEFNIDDHELYSFEIDPYIEEIDMGYMECINGVYRDVFKMTLYLGDYVEGTKNFSKSHIGSIQYNINVNGVDGRNITTENEYNLYKTPIKDIVIYTKDDNNGIRNHFAIVDLLSMPEELCLDDIRDNISKVRRKKK